MCTLKWGRNGKGERKNFIIDHCIVNDHRQFWSFWNKFDEKRQF